MSDLLTTIPRDYRKVTYPEAGLVATETKIRLDAQTPVNRVKPKRVTEAEYWEKYYNNQDVIYEWNNGLLEEKPVSDYENVLMYLWFLELLRNFFSTRYIAKTTGLGIGFRLNLPDKITIRRPDLGVVLDSNPIPIRPEDRTYPGIFDMCIEVLSDSKPEEMERDTDTKFGEYAAAGVKEYYMLYAKGEPMEFYTLNPQGMYLPMTRVMDDIIKSQVLPGFQFRISDLSKQPAPKEMAFDPLYQEFVLPYYREEKNLRQAAEAQVIEERKARMAEKTAAEDRIKCLEAKLARLEKS